MRLSTIEGLKGLAILFVTLFHLDFNSFSGGFIGVDIFFVISGFLITGSVLRDIGDNNFSLWNFYNRRIRRLFPAMLFTLGISAIVAFYTLSPQHFESYAGSVISSLFLVSNIFFYSESGYFGIDAIFKPLLHLWAIGVIGQFYLFFPLILLFLLKFRKKHLLLIGLLLLGITSLVASEYYTQVDLDAAYFLTPLRFFEFIIGSMCYWLKELKIPDKFKEFGIIAGLTLIIYSATFFHKYTPFPGFNALVPTIGVALVILSKNPRYSGYILRNKIITHIGKISYSLYLVHWPIIVFFNYMSFITVTLSEKTILLLASLICGEILYLLIEIPNNTKSKNKKFLIVIGLFMLLMTTPAIHAWNNQGWKWRL
ncbi:MAG: acyltransferase, partial [Candidatus Altiarchaeota archaeon]|nr:acyltransferase [Candidatus Altiarchaeota archaeon]